MLNFPLFILFPFLLPIILLCLKDNKYFFLQKNIEKMQQNQCVQNVKSFLTEHCQKLQMRRNFTKNFQNSILGKIYCTPKIKNIIKILKNHKT